MNNAVVVFSRTLASTALNEGAAMPINTADIVNTTNSSIRLTPA
jgi:hypothetical protein